MTKIALAIKATRVSGTNNGSRSFGKREREKETETSSENRDFKTSVWRSMRTQRDDDVDDYTRLSATEIIDNFATLWRRTKSERASEERIYCLQYSMH
jgi:hypothetical protein